MAHDVCTRSYQTPTNQAVSESSFRQLLGWAQGVKVQRRSLYIPRHTLDRRSNEKNDNVTSWQRFGRGFWNTVTWFVNLEQAHALQRIE
jgi:hypothetical protein